MVSMPVSLLWRRSTLHSSFLPRHPLLTSHRSMSSRVNRVVSVRDLLVSGLEMEGRDVTVEGWLKSARGHKSVKFLQVSDGSSPKSLQAVVDMSGDSLTNLDAIHSLGVGTAVQIQGKVTKSPAKGQTLELQNCSVEVVGECDQQEFPLQKKKHSPEFLREIAHLRPRSNTHGMVIRMRNAATMGLHDFFQRNGFVHVHTPILTSSDCEGAGEMFRVVTPDDQVTNDESRDPADTYFGKDVHLTVSGQLQAEMYATALSKVYTFGPTFRAENSNTGRHLSEFWMLEPEMSFASLEDVMDNCEQCLQHVAQWVLKMCTDDLDFIEKWIDKDVKGRIEQLSTVAFERMDYSEAIRYLQSCGAQFEVPVSWENGLATEHEKHLAEHLNKPVFVFDYPEEIKPFYMRVNDDQRTVGAVDLLVPRIGELVGGSAREERLNVLKARMTAKGISPEAYQWYLDLRKYGSVPHGGYGVGFERLMLYLTGLTNIRDVIPLPRHVGSCPF